MLQIIEREIRGRLQCHMNNGHFYIYMCVYTNGSSTCSLIYHSLGEPFLDKSQFYLWLLYFVGLANNHQLLLRTS